MSSDLTARFGRGFSRTNLQKYRQFYLAWTVPEICPTASGESPTVVVRNLPAFSYLRSIAARFPLSWSHYVRLLSVTNPLAREFHETEALRGGWTVRQLDRQIGSQFYERTALSQKKKAMLR